MSRLSRLDELLATPVSTRSMAVVRMLVGAITVAHLWPIASAAFGGDTYHDHFHHPYVSWYPEFGTTGYTITLAVGIAAAIAFSVGWLTRAAGAAAATVVGYHLFLSTTHVHNNRAYLFAVLAILAMAPCGRTLSIDSWRAAKAGRPLEATAPAWTLWLLRIECASVYGASGLSKLIDPDWFGGTVTWARVTAQETMVRASILPDPVADLLLNRSFHSFAAKGIVLTELFIAVGLWWRPIRRWAVLAAIVFHVMIEFSAEVQIFSYVGLAVLFVWAPPSLPTDPIRRRVTRRRTAATPPPIGASA